MRLHKLKGGNNMTHCNRVAVVTGGGQGNGKGITAALAKAGVKVAIFDVSDVMDETVAEFNAEGFDVAGYKVDIRSHDQIKAAVDSIIEHWGKIDILVNNAGVMACLPFLEADDKNRDFHIDVNVKGPWNVTQEIIPHMLENHYGRIVTISSVTGAHVSDGADTAYALTKAALVGFGKSIAMEYIRDGITSNVVCPGYCRTPMVMQEAMEQMPDNPEEFFRQLASSLPIKRLGTPEDIGALVAYLTSDEAGFLTAQDIVIDGGCISPETGMEIFED